MIPLFQEKKQLQHQRRIKPWTQVQAKPVPSRLACRKSKKEKTSHRKVISSSSVPCEDKPILMSSVKEEKGLSLCMKIETKERIGLPSGRDGILAGKQAGPLAPSWHRSEIPKNGNSRRVSEAAAAVAVVRWSATVLRISTIKVSRKGEASFTRPVRSLVP